MAGSFCASAYTHGKDTTFATESSMDFRMAAWYVFCKQQAVRLKMTY